MEVLANDDHIDGVSKVGMEDVGDVAIGEHFFDLVCTGVGSSHDGTRQRDWNRCQNRGVDVLHMKNRGRN